VTQNRLRDYLDHMELAASNACSFIEGLGKDEFLADKRTQQAVIMSLMIIGEAAAKVAENHSMFIEQHPEILWDSMRGMRNRIAHGYFDINLDVVWNTAQSALPELLERLPAARKAAADLSPASVEATSRRC